MLNSSFGKNLKITIAGGSHEKEMILNVKGLPAGKIIDMNELDDFLKKRSPGQSDLTTSRKEDDIVYIVEEGGNEIHPQSFTTSDNMSFTIKNKNHNSKEYNLKYPRPGHADLPAYLKYGDSVNMSGGGPFSGRMTAMLCVIGGIALQLLKPFNIEIHSQAQSVGYIKNRPVDPVAPVSSPISQMMKDEISYAKEDGNSIGGIIEVFATGLPTGLGGPMYDGVESILSPIFFGIPGVKGIEFGNGFAASNLMGSENNDDIFALTSDNKIITATNNHGGILGGLTTGMPLILRVGFKPTPSISKTQRTINLETGKPETFKIEGRHDPCIVPRALPVTEAATAVGILDMMLGEGYFKEDLGLTDLREKIDNLDNQLLDLLNKRMSISAEVAQYKLEHNMEICNSARENEILQKVGSQFENIYKEIFNVSKEIQQDLFRNERKESEAL